MRLNQFRPYRQGDLVQVWNALRADDLREFQAVGVTNPATIESYLNANAIRVTTWETEGGPVAVLGVTPSHDPMVGLVWAVASTDAYPRWRFAVRHTEQCLAQLGQGFRLLANYKDSRNHQQIQWLKRVGFTFICTHANHEGTGVAFHEFVRIVK